MTKATKRSQDEDEKIDQIWKCLLANNSDEVDTTTITTRNDDDVDGSAKDRRRITMAVACNNDVDLWSLRSLALSSGGFVNAEIRQIAWCKLLGLQHEQTNDDDVVATDDDARNSPYTDCDLSTSATPTDSPTTCTISTNDFSVIQQDVPRSVIFRYPSMIQMKEKERDHVQNDNENQQSSLEIPTALAATTTTSMKEKLVHVVQSTLVVKPRCNLTTTSTQSPLHYYQGLHDVAGVILYNLHSTRQTCNVVRRICQSHLREALRDDNFAKLMWLLRTILHPMIQYRCCPPKEGCHQEDNLHSFLRDSQVDLANCILPWVITWFTHDIHNEQIASRLVDAFIASHSLFPVYFAVSILVHPKNQQDILETECDPAMVHMTIRGLLSKLTFEQQVEYDEGHGAGSEYDDMSTNTVPVQDLIDDALLLMKSLPPRSLLDLASTYDISIIADDFWEIASSVSLLKAPPSWALASTSRHCLIMSNHKYDNLNGCDDNKNNNINTHDYTKNRNRNSTNVKLDGGWEGTATCALNTHDYTKNRNRNNTNVQLDGGWEGTATCALLLPLTRKGKMNDPPPNYDRARLASGVPMLMNMVDERRSLVYSDKRNYMSTTIQKPGDTSLQKHCVPSSSKSLWNKCSGVLFTRKSLRLGQQGT